MSDSASVVLYLQQIGFCSAASAAALLYDYLLAFGSEVDLIWAREWNLVTLLYAIVRYLSFFVVVDNAFYMGNTIWSPQVSYLHLCLVWYQIRMWGPYVFRVAMDIIMMKRIYALSRTPGILNAPKLVLVTMITACVAKYAASITMLLLAIGPSSNLTSIDVNYSGTYVCGTMIPLSTLLISTEYPTLCFEVLLFGLAFSYFVADVWGVWRSEGPKMCKVNDIVQILVRDSTIYFAINVVSTALNFGNYTADVSTVYIAMSMALQLFLPFCFAPRLVINVKEHENRVHMSRFGGDSLNNVQLNEGLDHLPQGIQQMEDFA